MRLRKRFALFFLMCFLGMILIGSCTPGSPASTAETNETIIDQPTPDVETHIVVQTLTPTALNNTGESVESSNLPTKVNEAVTETPIVEQSVMPEEGFNNLIGNLLLVTFDGDLLEVSLSTGKTEPLLSNNDAWLVWQYAISPNNQYLAYWLHTTNGTELWVSELANWEPELLLDDANSITYEAVNLWWINNQYLLLESGIIDQRVSLFVPQKSYVIDMSQKQIVLENTGYSYGCLLAPSSKTSEIATWCPVKEDWTDVESYYSTEASAYIVFEEGESYWISTETPENILVELKSPQNNWVWSQSRELVAFPSYISSEKRDSLQYIDQRSLTLMTLSDPESEHVFFNDESAWSPNQNYLAYVGQCAGNDCYYIVDVNTNSVIWTSQKIPQANHLRSLAWSSDSQYVAILTDEGIFIVDVQSGSTVKEIESLSGNLIAWEQ